jgi:predicted MFS family arabinose efflux permease
MTSPPALWRDPGFARLWAAQAVSAFGARITREGLPILAVTTLAAPPLALGALSAMSGAAALILGFAAGGFVDSRARRPILVWADLARLAALATVPIAAALRLLSLPQVLIVAGLIAACSVVFEMASHAYLPSLVPSDRLVEANSRLATTESLAEIGGPALAGLIFQVLAAPFALLFTSATYGVSALFLGAIRGREPPPEPHAHEAPGLTQGLRIAWAKPVVRTLLVMGMIQGLCGGAFGALYVLYALRTLAMPTSLLGLAIAFGGVGALIGAWLGPALGRRIGLGPAILVTLLGSCTSALGIALAPTDRLGATLVMIVTQIGGDAFGVAALVLMISLRQASLPQAVLGRVGGAFQASAGGLAILGALGGGWLGGAIGPRLAIAVLACGLFLIPLIGALSPLRKVREPPLSA